MVVVIDVLRATTTMCVAIDQGAVLLPIEPELIPVGHRERDDTLSLRECDGVELVAVVVARASPERSRVPRQRAIEAVDEDGASVALHDNVGRVVADDA